MKQKLLATLCAVTLTAGLLAGCGSDTKTATKETTTEETQTQDEDAQNKDTEDTEVTGKEVEGSDKPDENAVSEKEAEDAGFSDGTEEEGTDSKEKKAKTEESDASQAVQADDASATEDSAADSKSAASSDKEEKNKTDETAAAATEAVQADLDTSKPLAGIHHAQLDIEDYGTIQLELDADTAPVTVTNFVKLAQEHFYDGLTFHRIMDGFMIQGGDPDGSGKGGSDETIKGEFSSNGVENNISHVRGTVSMARTLADPDSASSQFFIVQSDSTFLDGDYAGFGIITEGMDIVDQICKDSKPTDNNGSIPAEEQPIITSIVITD